jgi:hypothetical protein
MIEQKKEITCIAYLGKLYVTKDFLMIHFGVSDRTITNWIQKGLEPIKDKNFSNKNLFILKEVEEWKEKNISQIKSDNAKGKDTEINIEDKDMNSLFDQYKNGTADEKRRLLLKEPQLIESINKIEDIIKKEALNKDFDTRYVLKDKVKKGQQEMSSMFVSFLKTAMPVLSKDLQHKSQEEIYHELDRYFEKEIKHLLTYISKEEQEIVTYYDLTTLMTKIIANDKKTSQEIKQYFEGVIK